jgi:hypothetical protein
MSVTEAEDRSGLVRWLSYWKDNNRYTQMNLANHTSQRVGTSTKVRGTSCISGLDSVIKI